MMYQFHYSSSSRIKPLRCLPTHLLLPVLSLLSVLSVGLLDLLGKTGPHKSVLGLELLLAGLVIVDQTETGRSTTTELGLETEDGHSLLLGLVESGELLLELSLGDGGSVGVEDVKNELLSVEQSVRDELSSSEGDGAVALNKVMGKKVSTCQLLMLPSRICLNLSLFLQNNPPSLSIYSQQPVPRYSVYDLGTFRLK